MESNMSYRIIKIDSPVIIATHEFTDEEGNPVSPGSPGELWLKQTAEQTIDGVRRYYYSALSPHRILVATRTGKPLQPGKRGYWKALIGWDDGTSRFTLQEDAGKRHTKITIDTTFEVPPVEDANATPLSEIVAKAPRSDRAGGWLSNTGRPEIREGDPTEARTITLPASLWRWIEELGDGNRSAGVRQIAEKARKETT